MFIIYPTTPTPSVAVQLNVSVSLFVIVTIGFVVSAAVDANVVSSVIANVFPLVNAVPFFVILAVYPVAAVTAPYIVVFFNTCVVDIAVPLELSNLTVNVVFAPCDFVNV